MTDVNLMQSDSVIAAYLQGEIDHHTAIHLREKIDRAVCAAMPQTLVLDFSAITFMDSSGVGLILGRHKLMVSLGGECCVQNAPENVQKMLKIAGISSQEKEIKV